MTWMNAAFVVAATALLVGAAFLHHLYDAWKARRRSRW